MASQQAIAVTPSCGCVFCDLKINRIRMRRQYIHYVDRRVIVCTKE